MIVVPMRVVLDGSEYREFEDLDSRTFYDALASGVPVSTSQPPPGAFVDAYEAARRNGARRALSIHIGSNLSGTVNSARIAAGLARIPVDVIDTGQASFIEGLCVLEAAEALENGAAVESIREVVAATSRVAGNVFIVGGLRLLEQGGRLAPNAETPPGVPVLALVEGAVRPVGSAASAGEALDAMLSHLDEAIARQPDKSMRVGVGNGCADELARELEARVRERGPDLEVIPYEIGPAVGAHTGAGCTGLVYLPRPVSV
jgi:DegV family protein with EDD domain